MSELNLEYEVLKLVLKALNKHELKKDAIEALGITKKTLCNWFKKYNIVKKENEYISITLEQKQNNEK